MRKRIGVGAIALLGTACVFVTLSHRSNLPDPIHKGRHVSEWVDACILKPGNHFSPQEQEVLTILGIGSNAVPHLIHAIEDQPGFRSSSSYKAIYGRTPSWMSKRLPLPVDPENVRFRAYGTLGALGPAAKSAVPFLAEQFTMTNRELDFVRTALISIGLTASNAIPVLTNAFHSTDQRFRSMAARTLAGVQPNNSELLPTMVAELESTNAFNRRMACIVLGGLGPAARLAVPNVKQMLNDEDKSVRELAENALRAIEPGTNGPPLKGLL